MRAPGAPARRPLLVLAFAGLLFGILTGLARFGITPFPAVYSLVPLHGALMAAGFFGTVIALERAVALAAAPAYLGPLAGAAGVLLLLLGLPPVYGGGALLLASIGLVGASAAVYLRQAALFTATLLLGALAWLAGNVAWLGWGILAAVPWWAAFLVLTIAGERLELSRFLPPTLLGRRLFAAVVLLLSAGLLAQVAALDVLHLLFPAGLLALALWLARYDVARRTVRGEGLTRFTAVCLLSGYAWLAFAGLAGLLSGGLFDGGWRDSELHAVFLGFVFAMVFGHAPIILPAVTGWRIAYHPLFYLHLGLLHASLLLRVAGELSGASDLRIAGAVGNAVALVLFLLATLTGVLRGRRGG